MARLPDYTALGRSAPSFDSGRAYPSMPKADTDMGASAIARGAKSLGLSVAAIGDDYKRSRDSLDAARADADLQADMLELNRRFDDDPDWTTYDQRYTPEAKAIAEKTASYIKDPQIKERFLLRARGDIETGRHKLLSRGKDLAKQSMVVEAEGILDKHQARYIDPKASEADRAQASADLEANIELLKRNTLITPEQEQALKEKYIKGTQKKDAETRLDLGDEALDADLDAALKEVNSRSADPDRLDDLQKSRGLFRTGSVSVSVGGEEVKIGTYGSGAGKRNPNFPSTPYGIYPIGPIRQTKLGTVMPFGKAGADEYKEKDFNENQGFDARAGRTRSQQEFHVATNSKLATKGCISLSKDEYRKLVPMVAKIKAKYGQAYVAVNPDGSVKVFGRGDENEAEIRGQFNSQINSGVRVADASGKIPESALPKTKSRYWALAPDEIADLKKRAKAKISEKRTSQYWSDKKQIDGYISQVREFGRTPEGFDFEGTLKRIEEVQPSVANGLRLAAEEAKAVHAASQSEDGRPLAHMSNDDLEAHVSKLAQKRLSVADPGQADLVNNVYDDIAKRADRILKQRESDPAASVHGDPDNGIAEHPRVRQAMGSISARHQTAEGGAITGGAGDYTPEDWQELVAARMEAQADLGLEPQPITKEEAKALLDMPSTIDPGTPEFMEKLESAAGRIEAQFGKRIAKDIFQSAIRLTTRGKIDPMVIGVMSQMASGEDVSPEDLRKITKIKQIEQNRDAFRRSVRPEMGAQGAGPYVSPSFSKEQQKAKQKRAPNDAAKQALLADPRRAAEFDAYYYRGAAAEVLAQGAKSKQ